MESFESTIQNIHPFLAIIQDACDQRRIFIEKRNKQAHEEFVRKWKAEKIASSIQKTENRSSEQEKDEVTLLEDEIEELALADRLLKKARNIRLKTQNSLMKCEDSVRSLLQVTSVENNTSNSNGIHSQKLKILPNRKEESSSCKGSVPRSKSASISTNLKPTTVPRSKSANIHKSSKATDSAPSQRTKGINGSGKNQSVSILPKNTFEEYKRMKPVSCSRSSSSCTKLKPSTVPRLKSANVQTHLNGIQKCNEISKSSKKQGIVNKLEEVDKFKSDSVMCKTNSKIILGEVLHKQLKPDAKELSNYQNLSPTYQHFLKECQRISISNSSIQIPRHVLWYPFMNLHCKKYFLENFKYGDIANYTKAVRLIHQIQEALLWIDLFTLIGKDITPKLHLLDESDLNALRLCSYLESIYGANQQRTPIIDTNQKN